MIEFKIGMNVHLLKEAITKKRDSLHLPIGAVMSIYLGNSDENQLKLKPKDILAIPEEGTTGAGSPETPYFFTILIQPQGGNLFHAL